MDTYIIFNGDEGTIAAYMVINAIRKKLKNFPGEIKKIIPISGPKEDLVLWRFLPEKTENSIIYSLDLALSKNLIYVEKFLAKNNLILYIDHHYPGKIIPEHKNFNLLLADDRKHNTSTFVNELCGKIFDLWATAGASGDNKIEIFNELSFKNNLSDYEKKLLWRFGKFINSHSFSPKDKMSPTELLKDLLNYFSPFDYIKNSKTYAKLAQTYLNDIKNVRSNIKTLYEDKNLIIIEFPAGDYSQRMFAGLAYWFYEHNKEKVIFCLFPQSTTNEGTLFSVSIRSNSNANLIAEQLGGGGRHNAAGANYLLKKNSDIREFIIKIKKSVENAKSS